MAKSFYAVKKGKKTGVFTTWAETQKAVSGYPHADFKGFKTLEEANEYLGTSSTSTPSTTVYEQKHKIKTDIIQNINQINQTNYNQTNCKLTNYTTYTAYTDGSFKNDVVGYGFVLIKDNEPLILDCGRAIATDLTERNVIGELASIIKLIELCNSTGISNINICYDYEGVAKWATGEWKSNKPLTRAYSNYMRAVQATGGIKINFIKVQAHSGVHFNELADNLANKGRQSFSGVDIDYFVGSHLA